MAERADILAREEVDRWRRDGVRPGLDVIRRTMEAAERGVLEGSDWRVVFGWGTVYGHCLHALVRDHRDVAEAAILEAMQSANDRIYDGAALAFLWFHGLADPWRISAACARTKFERLQRPFQCVHAYAWLHVEVENGGFSQFYVNCWGYMSPLLIEFLSEIGADESAAIVRESVEAFTGGRELPPRKLAKLLNGPQKDHICDVLERLDERFGADPDRLLPRVARYIYAHRGVLGDVEPEGWPRLY
jgi:hypothetical protein